MAGYVKLICFCIWAVKRIEQLRDKQVTHKRPGIVLSAFTAAAIVLQIGSGIALSVYGSLIQGLHSSFRQLSLPTVWWIGIEPIVVGIVGLAVIYQRRRKRIVIWIIINFVLCLGNGILMAYTNVLDDNKYGVRADDRERCRNPSSFTMTSTTTTTYMRYMNSGDESDDGEAVSQLTCEQVLVIDPLLTGLMYSLLTYLGVVLLVTVVASVIGCCLQECVEDQGLSGPDFVPVEQGMLGHGPGLQFLHQYPPGPPPAPYPQFHLPAQPSTPGQDNVSNSSNDAFLVDSDRQLLV